MEIYNTALLDMAETIIITIVLFTVFVLLYSDYKFYVKIHSYFDRNKTEATALYWAEVNKTLNWKNLWKPISSGTVLLIASITAGGHGVAGLAILASVASYYRLVKHKVRT